MATERIVGIDLGTTNSLVAYMEGDRPVVIPGEDGLNLVPSVVALDDNGQIVVGSAARKYLIETPERAVYSVKRLMGRDVEDVRDELKLFPFRLAEDLAAGEVLRIKLGEKTFTPPEISAFILRQLKRNAERYFAAPVTKAVITVPAYFNDAQRQATKDAGRIAGLEVLRLVNEPTAASLAYGLDKKNAETVAVYDLGGGTFDISILKLHEGIFEVIATNGDTHLGGDDIDNLLITISLHDIQGDLAIDVRRNAEIVQAIRKAVIEAKIALSSDEKTTLDVELPGGKRYQREITRAQFEQLIQPVDRSHCRTGSAGDEGCRPDSEADQRSRVGRRLDANPARPSTGGRALSAHAPQRTESRRSSCARRSHPGPHPCGRLRSDQGNAAARRDATLARYRIVGGGVVKIIHRNSTIPASATEHFTTGVEGQTNVAVHVVQGERELASDCRSLARFDLKGIPPMPAGLPRIEVKFLIDANGILHVSARELRSGKEAEIQVQPSYGLTDEQVENMILDSFDNAEEDFRRRQVIEARNEAETMLTALEKGRKNPAWEQLSSKERGNVGKLEKALRAVVNEDDYQAIRTAIDALNQGTMHLAELMMESAVGTALKGQNMDTADVGEGPASPHPIAQAEIER